MSEKKYIIYHKALERSLNPLQARYDELCKEFYNMLAAKTPGMPTDQGLPTFFEALETDISAGSDAQPVEMLANLVARTVVYDYVLEALGMKSTETPNEIESAAQIMNAAHPAIDICTGTPSEIAARAAEYGNNWTYALYDTVSVSKTAKYERVRAYIRAIAPGVFADSRPDVLQAANIQHTGITPAYTMQEFTQLTKAKRGVPNDYTYTKTTKKTTKKGTTSIIPATKTHVTYTVENPEMSNGYTFDETDEAEIQRIWSYITPIAKLYIEAIDNLLRRIDIDSPTAQIFWVDDSGLVSGKRYLTIEQIIREVKKLDTNAGIAPETKTDALEMLERLCCIRAAIDYNDVIPLEGCGRNVVRDYLISFVYRDVIIKGKQTRVLVFNSISVFGQYVQQLQELTGRARVLNLPNSYLCNPNKKSSFRDAVLYRELAGWIFAKGTHKTRYFKGFYVLLGDTDGKQRQRTRQAIKSALDYYLTLSDCPFKAWKYWNGKDGDGIELLTKKCQQDTESQLDDVQKRLTTVEQKIADFE